MNSSECILRVRTIVCALFHVPSNYSRFINLFLAPSSPGLAVILFHDLMYVCMYVCRAKVSRGV